MTPKKARWLMRQPWYKWWRICGLQKEYKRWDHILEHTTYSSVGYCTKQLYRLARKQRWYKEHPMFNPICAAKDSAR